VSVLFTLTNVIDVYVSVTFTSKRPVNAGAIYGTLSMANFSTMKFKGARVSPKISWRNDPPSKLYLHSSVILLPSAGVWVRGFSVNMGSLPDNKRQCQFF